MRSLLIAIPLMFVMACSKSPEAGQIYENLLTRDRFQIASTELCVEILTAHKLANDGLDSLRAFESQVVIEHNSLIETEIEELAWRHDNNDNLAKAEIAPWYRKYKAGEMDKDAYWDKVTPIRTKWDLEKEQYLDKYSALSKKIITYPYPSSFPPYHIGGLRDSYSEGESCITYELDSDDYVLTVEELEAGYNLIK
ncbi:hypothetical protein ACFLRO_00565 [Bacteroidota bacterium]